MNENARPLVSVIIPTYNWSTVLPFSIGSALSQTYTNMEILVVGDGCTDDSEAVVSSIKDGRVRFINLPANTGHQSEPNNEGLKQAQGELVAYLGHDDLWLPHHLSCMTAELAAGHDVVYGLTGMVDLHDEIVHVEPTDSQYQPGSWLPPTGVAHRRKIIEKVGGWRHYRELFCDPEIDLWQRMHDSGYRFSLVPRLTAIKFPASMRQDAYKNRSCGEQARWTQLIKDTPDLEPITLVNLLLPFTSYWKNKHINHSYKRILKEFLQQTYLAARGNFTASRPLFAQKGQAIADRRKFKGLDG